MRLLGGRSPLPRPILIARCFADRPAAKRRPHPAAEAFPNDALRGVVGILKEHWTLDPFPAIRAYEAHNLAKDADITRYAPKIAAEILWWGSHTLLRQFNGVPAWREVVAEVATSIGVPAKDRTSDLPAWRVEGAVLRKALSDWEKLSPTQRQEVLGKAGADFGVAPGGPSPRRGQRSLSAARICSSLLRHAVRVRCRGDSFCAGRSCARHVVGGLQPCRAKLPRASASRADRCVHATEVA
jgi:hypothetical protein